MQLTMTPARARWSMASRTSIFRISTLSSAKNATFRNALLVKASTDATCGMSARLAFVTGLERGTAFAVFARSPDLPESVDLLAAPRVVIGEAAVIIILLDVTARSRDAWGIADSVAAVCEGGPERSIGYAIADARWHSQANGVTGLCIKAIRRSCVCMSRVFIFIHQAYARQRPQIVLLQLGNMVCQADFLQSPSYLLASARGTRRYSVETRGASRFLTLEP